MLQTLMAFAPRRSARRSPPGVYRIIKHTDLILRCEDAAVFHAGQPQVVILRASAKLTQRESGLLTELSESDSE